MGGSLCFSNGFNCCCLEEALIGGSGVLEEWFCWIGGSDICGCDVSLPPIQQRVWVSWLGDRFYRVRRVRVSWLGGATG